MATIRERNGRYQIRVSCGYDSTGKQVIKTHSWTPDPKLTPKQREKELQRQVVDFENKVKQGYAVGERTTFEKYSEYVIELKERTGLKHTTITRYKSFRDTLNPLVGYMKIDEIRPAHLNNLYAELGKDGMNKKTGGKLSSKTIIEYHQFISTILSQAEKEMIIPYNPASKATPPKLAPHKVNYFQQDEIIAIRDALENVPLKWKVASHLLLLLSGARRGEIMGLKWAMVDFRNNSIMIDNNLLYRADVGIYEDTTKNETSVRSIKLPEETMKLLRQYRMWQNEQITLNGGRVEDGGLWYYTDFLFTQKDGKPMHPDSLTGWLSDFSKRNKLPHINPHAFRHTMASILYFNGVDSITISKRLGHAKVSTTSDIYSHIIKEADAKAADCIGDIVLHSEKKA